jgi:hypothetical protein
VEKCKPARLSGVNWHTVLFVDNVRKQVNLKDAKFKWEVVAVRALQCPCKHCSVVMY